MFAGPDYPLCRLYHGRAPRRLAPPPDQLSNFKFLPRCVVLTFERAVEA